MRKKARGPMGHWFFWFFWFFWFCSSVAARARDRTRPPSPGVRVGPMLAIPSQFSSSLIDEICAPVSEFEGAELPGPRWRACLGASSVGVFSRFSPTGRARSTSSFPLFFLLFFLPSPPSSSPVPLPAPFHPKTLIRFSPRHNSLTPAEEAEMVAALGFSSLDELIDATVPASIRAEKPLDLGEYTEGFTESEFLEKFK